MRTLDLHLIKRFRGKRIPSFKQLRHLPKFFSQKERRLVGIASTVLVLTLLLWIGAALNARLAVVPDTGGEYAEAIVGKPQFINPLYSRANEADNDVTALVFSGLLKLDSELNLVPDLAKEYTSNPEQTEFVFTLRENLMWHDGQPLTAADVVFTYELIQEPLVASPLRGGFQGVAIEQRDQYTVVFKLAKPFAPFLTNLTVGILPLHIWSGVAPEEMQVSRFNYNPVGNGPYKLENVVREAGTGRISQISLLSNKYYHGKVPYISKVNLRFYSTPEDALRDVVEKKVDGLHFLPQRSRGEAQRKFLTVYSLDLSQYTSVFFNQRTSDILKDATVRKALAHAVDKKRIVQEGLKGEGHVIVSPVLPGFVGYDPELEDYAYDPQRSRDMLKEAKWEEIDRETYVTLKTQQLLADIATSTAAVEDITSSETEMQDTTDAQNGLLPGEADVRAAVEASIHEAQTVFWKKGEELLEIELTTAATPELAAVAELISGFWQQAGVVTPVRTIEPRSIIRDALRSRSYEALLYGEIVGADPDLYPFWHSSQAEHPGLNLSVYSDRDVDELLVASREATSTLQRADHDKKLQALLLERLPALFLYRPTYTYVVNKEVKGVGQKHISMPSDRFNDIEYWYIETRRQWKKAQQ